MAVVDGESWLCGLSSNTVHVRIGVGHAAVEAFQTEGDGSPPGIHVVPRIALFSLFLLPMPSALIWSPCS